MRGPPSAHQEQRPGPRPQAAQPHALPKAPPSVTQADVGAPEEDLWTWDELQIGQSVDIFCRTLLILDADPFTREFYEDQGLPLGEPIALERPKVPDVRRIIPPYIGFGSEEDSLQSVFHIRPKAPNCNTPQMKKFGMRSLTYALELIAKSKVDEGRRFTLQYFLGNDTVSIREPPIRNSGHMGGNFLYRSKIKRKDGSNYESCDFFVGAELNVLSQDFCVVEADENTLMYMESNSNDFPQSNILRVVQLLRPYREAIARLCCTKYDHSGGTMTVNELEELFRLASVRLSPQEFITLKRKLDKRKRGFFLYSKLLKLIALEDPHIMR